MPQYQLSHLDLLEHEAIHILRETSAQFESAAILFSGGKDSLVLAALARKAFAPARPPFPLLHIDTGHNFPETIEFGTLWLPLSAIGSSFAKFRRASTQVGPLKRPA